MATAQDAIRLARRYDGVTESPRGSNRQRFGEWYGANGVAWCAIFLSYVLYTCGVRFTGATTAKGFAYCPYIMAWAKKNKRWHGPGKGLPGDWVLYQVDSDAAPDHVELVVAQHPDGSVTSIGGNTGGLSANGGRVQEHTWPAHAVIGFMRPPYAAVVHPAPPKTVPPKSHLTRVLMLTSPMQSGTDVARAAAALASRGYRVGTPANVFGPMMDAAVRAYQKRTGLEVDGRIGPVTGVHLGL